MFDRTLLLKFNKIFPILILLNHNKPNPPNRLLLKNPLTLQPIMTRLQALNLVIVELAVVIGLEHEVRACVLFLEDLVMGVLELGDLGE